MLREGSSVAILVCCSIGVELKSVLILRNQEWSHAWEWGTQNELFWSNVRTVISLYVALVKSISVVGLKANGLHL